MQTSPISSTPARLHWAKLPNNTYQLEGADFGARVYCEDRRWKLELEGVDRVFDLGYRASFDTAEVVILREMYIESQR